jgi:hypothetical protein
MASLTLILLGMLVNDCVKPNVQRLAVSMLTGHLKQPHNKAMLVEVKMCKLAISAREHDHTQPR